MKKPKYNRDKWSAEQMVAYDISADNSDAIKFNWSEKIPFLITNKERKILEGANNNLKRLQINALQEKLNYISEWLCENLGIIKCLIKVQRTPREIRLKGNKRIQIPGIYTDKYSEENRDEIIIYTLTPARRNPIKWQSFIKGFLELWLVHFDKHFLLIQTIKNHGFYDRLKDLFELFELTKKSLKK